LSFLGIDIKIIKVPFEHFKDKKSTNQSCGSMYKEIVSNHVQISKTYMFSFPLTTKLFGNYIHIFFEIFPLKKTILIGI